MDYTGHRFGALAVERPLGEHHKPGRHRRWVVRWDCCGTEQVVRQARLEDRRMHPVAQCPTCRLAEAPKPFEPAKTGAIRHPTWGWLWPLTWEWADGLTEVRRARSEWCL